MEITDKTKMKGGKYDGCMLGSINDDYFKFLYASYQAGIYAPYIEKRFPKLKELLTKNPKLRTKLAPPNRASFAR